MVVVGVGLGEWHTFMGEFFAMGIIVLHHQIFRQYISIMTDPTCISLVNDQISARGIHHLTNKHNFTRARRTSAMIGKGSNTNFADGVSSFSSTPGLNRTTNISKERQEEPDHPHSVVSWWSYTVWFRDVFLPLVATVNTPPYSMMSCLFLTCSLLFYCAEAVRTALVLYLVYCVADQLPKKPQKPYVVKMLQRWCNNSWFFRWTADYFPCKLHKSSCSSGVHEEEDNGPYIFAYHPHGVIGMGVNIALNTNACNFQKMFPGVSFS